MSKRKIVHEDSPVKSDGVDDSNGKLHACTTWQSQTPPPPARKRTTVNSTFAMSEDDQVRMAIEASLETNVGESKEESTPTVVWSPGTGVSEEQTRLHRCNKDPRFPVPDDPRGISIFLSGILVDPPVPK